eukprot:6549424-Pyramimonas_sp.AAC.1
MEDRGWTADGRGRGGIEGGTGDVSSTSPAPPAPSQARQDPGVGGGVQGRRRDRAGHRLANSRTPCHLEPPGPT